MVSVMYLLRCNDVLMSFWLMHLTGYRQIMLAELLIDNWPSDRLPNRCDYLHPQTCCDILPGCGTVKHRLVHHDGASPSIFTASRSRYGFYSHQLCLKLPTCGFYVTSNHLWKMLCCFPFDTRNIYISPCHF
jgi:hypothetical protein